MSRNETIAAMVGIMIGQCWCLVVLLRNPNGFVALQALVIWILGAITFWVLYFDVTRGER